MPPPSKSARPSQQEFPRHPFLLGADELQRRLGTNVETGLSGQAARDAQLQYGPNRLEGEGAVRWYVVLGKQTSNAMILVSFVFYLMGGAFGPGDEGGVGAWLRSAWCASLAGG